MELQAQHGGYTPYMPSIPPSRHPEPFLDVCTAPQCLSSTETVSSEPRCSEDEIEKSEVYTAVYNDPEEVVGAEDTAVKEMKQVKTKASIGVLSTLIAYVSVNSWFKTHHPEKFVWISEDREEAEWLATSKSWLDKKACRWLSICGGAHVHFATHRVTTLEHIPKPLEPIADGDWNWQNAWTEADDDPSQWNKDEKALREIPDYVFEYAPLVHLFSKEQYWPCDIAEHLYHVSPELNYTAIQSESEHATLNNLDNYNQYQRGRWVFLTSNDNVEEHPDWLGGEKNIPSVPDSLADDFSDNEGWIHHPGRTYLQGLKDALDEAKHWFTSDHNSEIDEDMKDSAAAAKAHARLILEKEKSYHQDLRRGLETDPDVRRIRGGRSEAPAVLVAIDKGHGIVDAFWFFFYSFNLGNSVFNIRFGNHVGDWEHTAIRFYKGTPKAVFFSEHNFGSAYSYEAVEKLGKRPVIYSAVGTHAMYATPGLHPYVLPWGILHDETDRGPLWDPALNSHAFTYDFKNDTLRASNATPNAPVGWFHFAGHWGDKFYPLGDKRQYRFAGQYHYVNGPLGPKFKNLGRKKICGGPDSQPCNIKHWLGGENRAGRLQRQGEEADAYSAETHEAQDLVTET